MNKKSGCLVIFLVVALVVSIGCNFFQFLALFGLGLDESTIGIVQPKEHFHETMEQEGASGTKAKIVRIDLEGVIAMAH